MTTTTASELADAVVAELRTPEFQAEVDRLRELLESDRAQEALAFGEQLIDKMEETTNAVGKGVTREERQLIGCWLGYKYLVALTT
jgi:hypothetical protein